MALHIYLDRAGTGRCAPNPELCQQPVSARGLLVGCLAAPAGICPTLERATVATMVLQTIKEHPQPAPQVKVPSNQRGWGGSIVRPSPQRQPGPTEHSDFARPVAGSWLRGWRAGQPQRLGRCRSAPRAARRARGCCASLEPAERSVERSHRRRLEKPAFEFKPRGGTHSTQIGSALLSLLRAQISERAAQQWRRPLRSQRDARAAFRAALQQAQPCS